MLAHYRRTTLARPVLLVAAAWLTFVAQPAWGRPDIVLPPVPPITVVAVGDIAFVSAVDRLIARSGVQAPVADVADHLSRAHLTIANLECAVSDRGRPEAGKSFTFRAPPSTISTLTYAGIDLVALGNNHTLDWGSDALLDTIRHLDDAGIAHAGAGLNRREAFSHTLVNVRGASVAFLSFSHIGPAYFAATDSRPGAAYTLDLAAVENYIADARSEADYVIVSFHWGVERDYVPTSRQTTWGRAAIDAGAHAVLSHHPHVVQGIEYYKRGLIAYSLGNFVFSPGSAGGRESIILNLTLTPTGFRNVLAHPIYIRSTGDTVHATGSTADRILGIVARTSEPMGTVVNLSGNSATLLPSPKPR